MKEIKVSELKEGMRFTASVYIEDENLFVPANIPIKQKDIDRLEKWRIEELYTDGTIVKGSDRGQNEIDKLINVLDAQADQKLLDMYYTAVETLDAVFESVAKNEPVDSEEVDTIVDELLPAIKDHKDEMISFMILSGHGASDRAESAVNTAIISVFTANSLKLPSHKVNLLAYAALLHDVGMMKIPDKVLKKEGELTQNELKIIQMHPIYSHKLITKTFKYPEEVGEIVLQHHERWDGKGYPNGLKGKEISLPARILSVADAFEAMVSHRPYRNSMIGYMAMKQLLNDNGRRFDSAILKAFIKVMGIYPIGSIVLLNDASIGRVLNTHIDAPLRPTIRLVVDSRGKKYTKEEVVIDLLKEKDLYIARAINPKELENAS
jgi:HD-GYP domain-containing protein (c-di-GMP phosphodiesterase class II)